MPPFVPRELTDAIIDYLQPYRDRAKIKNVDNLRNCALVCRSWTARSQQHLFADIPLGNEAQCARLHAVTQKKPMLAGYVRRLDLTTPEETVWFNTSEQMDMLLEACNQLVYVSVKCRSHAQTTALLARLPPCKELRTIMASYCVFPDPQALLTLVEAANGRDTLILKYVEVVGGGFGTAGEANGQGQGRASVRRLWFYMPTFRGHGSSVGVALGTGAAALCSLKATITHADDLRAVDALLEARGPAIEELHIDTVSWGDANEHDALLAALDLNHVPALRQLTFSECPIPDLGGAHWQDWITPSLGRMRDAATLERISIRLHVSPSSEARQLAGFYWDRLDALLAAAPVFAVLKCLTFVAITGANRLEDMHTIDPFIRERLPVLNARGMLRFEYRRPPYGPR